MGTAENNSWGSVRIPVSIKCCFAAQLAGESYQDCAHKKKSNKQRLKAPKNVLTQLRPSTPGGAVGWSLWWSPVQPPASSRSVAGASPHQPELFLATFQKPPRTELSLPFHVHPPGEQLSSSPCATSPSLRGQHEAGVSLSSDSPASSHRNVTLPRRCFLHPLPNPGLRCRRRCESSALSRA